MLVTVSLAAPVFSFVDHVFLHYLWYVLMYGRFTSHSTITNANALQMFIVIVIVIPTNFDLSVVIKNVISEDLLHNILKN